MPIDLPQANRMQARSLVTDFELATHGENFMRVRVREKMRDELFDAIVRQGMQHEDVPGGRRYWLDVLVLTPETLLHLVQREAERVLKEAGYAMD